ncbi:MAG TPA: hypothetical protein VHX88_19820 [Solirubrobacteraceae bacterium]|nr:hypothetical protein [Solirubrobacteraceae bacterium]
MAPLELILARNLLSSLSTPGFLLDERGELTFYNQAAGTLLGRRLEELASTEGTVWDHVGPFDDDGRRIPLADLPLATALAQGSPAHGRMRIRSFAGAEHSIEVSALPIVAVQGARGVMAFFWPLQDAT